MRAALPSQTGLPCAVCRRKSLGLHVSDTTSAIPRAPRYSPSGAHSHPVRRATEPTSARATTTQRRSRVVTAVVRKAPPTVRRDPTARWSRPTPEATPRGAQSRPGDRSVATDRPARKINTRSYYGLDETQITWNVERIGTRHVKSRT